MRTVTVDLGDRAYDVRVGPGAAGCLPDVLPVGAKRAAVVTQEGIGFDVDPGVPHERFTIGDGEGAKTMATVESLCSAWSRWGLTRGDVVVAVGGGVVTDTAVVDITPGGEWTFMGEATFDSVAAVPEPGEWAMIVAGLGVVGAAARRRKRA